MNDFQRYVQETEARLHKMKEDLERREEYLERKIKEAEKETGHALREVKEILPSLIKVKACVDYGKEYGETYYLRTEFHPQMIRDVMIQGRNHGSLIDCISREIADKVAHELRTMNFQRLI